MFDLFGRRAKKEAEEQRLIKEAQLEEERLKKMAEEQILAEQQRLEEEKKAEQQRIEQEKLLKEQKRLEEERRIAEHKKIEEEKRLREVQLKEGDILIKNTFKKLFEENFLTGICFLNECSNWRSNELFPYDFNNCFIDIAREFAVIANSCDTVTDFNIKLTDEFKHKLYYQYYDKYFPYTDEDKGAKYLCLTSDSSSEEDDDHLYFEYDETKKRLIEAASSSLERIANYTASIIITVQDYSNVNMCNLIDDYNKYGKSNLGYARLFYKINVFNFTTTLALAIIYLSFSFKYKDKIEENDEFNSLVNTYIKMHDEEFNGGIYEASVYYCKDLYDIYVELYNDVFGDELNYHFFAQTIYLYAQTNLSNFSLENTLYLNTIYNIDYNSILNDYWDSEEKNIICYTQTILKNKIFRPILESENFTVNIYLLSSFLLHETIDADSLEKWFSSYEDYANLLKKCEAYYKNYIILNSSSTQLDTLNSLKKSFLEITTGEEFEVFLKDLYEFKNYKVTLTPITNDQGADLILEKDGEKCAVQAKFYDTPVGNKAIQEVVAAINFYKCDKGIVVTNNSFTKSAIELAKANNVELIDGEKLKSLITLL